MGEEIDEMEDVDEENRKEIPQIDEEMNGQQV